MAYGSALVDTIQSSTTGTPPQFNDGSGAQIGTLCRAWVNFKGTVTVGVNASFNVSSVTRNSTGNYTITFTTAMPDANYASLGNDNSAANNTNVMTASHATGTCGVTCQVGTTAAYQDNTAIGVAIFR